MKFQKIFQQIKEKVLKYKVETLIIVLVFVLVVANSVQSFVELESPFATIGSQQTTQSTSTVSESYDYKKVFNSGTWVQSSVKVVIDDNTKMIATSSKLHGSTVKQLTMSTINSEKCINACKNEGAHAGEISSLVPYTNTSCNCYKVSTRCINTIKSTTGRDKLFKTNDLRVCSESRDFVSELNVSIDKKCPNCGPEMYCSTKGDTKDKCVMCIAPKGYYIPSCHERATPRVCPVCPNSNYVRVKCGGIKLGQCVPKPVCKSYEYYDSNNKQCLSALNCAAGTEPNDNASGCYSCLNGTSRRSKPLMQGLRKIVYDNNTKIPIYINPQYKSSTRAEMGYLQLAIDRNPNVILTPTSANYLFEPTSNQLRTNQNLIIKATIPVCVIDEFTGSVSQINDEFVETTFYNIALPVKCI